MTYARNIAPGEYYHLFNRGAHRMNVFREKRDWVRFLLLILYMQSPRSVKNLVRYVTQEAPTIGFLFPLKEQEAMVRERFVELTAFCIMPNHFHLLLKEVEEGGTARYMQRVLNSYSKYYNEKYQSSGHVFQGRYKSVHVKDDRQLVYLSAYIHRNPRELRAWKNKEFEYPYSSLQDYTKANRWGGLIVPDIIATQFGMTKDSNYADFVRTSTAKLLEGELEGISL